jgi:gamma-butyrobetaine dioxygenase
MTAIDAIGELFAGPGARDYLGEPVTIGEHMRQAAALAEAAGSGSWLVAAALLHDIGHLRSETESGHGQAGARWLSQWFGEAVTEPVRLHVAAKRYLCAVEPGYFGLLSAESVRTLALQGGPMTAKEATAFEAVPHARDAVAVRRWDDQAKDPAVTPPPFAHFAPRLEALLTLEGSAYFRGPAYFRGSAHLRGPPHLRAGPIRERACVRDSALTAIELRTLKATALPT